MPKANHDWLKPRFFGVGRSERKSQNLNSIYSITTRSKTKRRACPVLNEAKREAPLYKLSFVTFVCSNAKLDEEVFGTDCNCVARSWRV